MVKKYLINLDHRTDRLQKFMELNSDYLKDIERINGTILNENDIKEKKISKFMRKIRDSSPKNYMGMIGNLTSHLNIIKNNLDNDFDIWVFEDDCYITKEGYEFYNNHKKYIPEDCDIFYLSCTDIILPVPINNYVFEIKDSVGIHSIIYKNKSKKKIVDIVEKHIAEIGYDLLDIIYLNYKELNKYTFLINYTTLYDSKSDVFDDKKDFGIRYIDIPDIHNNIDTIKYYDVNETTIRYLDLKNHFIHKFFDNNIHLISNDILYKTL